MATQATILAWRIPMDRGAWRVQLIGLQRVEHNCSDLALCKKKSSMKLDTYISTRALVR